VPCGNTSILPAPDVISPQLGVVATRSRRYAGWRVHSARCVCTNGLTFEVCVGADRQCWPQEEQGPWQEVEIRVHTLDEIDTPSFSLSSLERYKRHTNDGHGSSVTYHRVPIDLLNRLIARNGGLV